MKTKRIQGQINSIRCRILGLVALFVLGQLLLTALLICSPVYAATYYVNASGGNDSRTSTQAQSISNPWATIGKCASTAVAGDTCMILAGTYDEYITPANSGSAGSGYITYAAYQGQTVVMRGFRLISKSYIRVIGFEITHNSTAYSFGFYIDSMQHCQILSNYIHNVYCTAIHHGGAAGTGANYNIIRGNTITMVSCPTGVAGQCNQNNGMSIQVSGNYNLIEYNTITRPGADYINVWGSKNIIRNNSLSDLSDSYWPDGGGAHVDTFQPGGDPAFPSIRHVYDSNFAWKNAEGNSHFLQIRDTVNAGDGNFIVRGNVGKDFGSYVAQLGAIDNVLAYNNTWVNFLTKATDYGIGANSEGGNPSTGNQWFNNILQDVSSGSYTAFYVAAGCSIAKSNNLCYGGGSSDSSCARVSNPLFTNMVKNDDTANDVTLTSGSPARWIGKSITTVTSATGSGTQFTVTNAGFFHDGFGVAEGDVIKVGLNSPVRIKTVNYTTNQITVASSISWTNGDGVVWRDQATTPDVGAYQYRARGYTLSGSYSQAGSDVTVVPSDPSLVRFVEVLVDGIPVGTATSSPYTVSVVGSGALTVKIYSLFASATPVIDTMSSVPTPPPPPPKNLRIAP